jgi:MoaA/NifB/PqqE/SkfB family radical SAM enzyme
MNRTFRRAARFAWRTFPVLQGLYDPPREPDPIRDNKERIEAEIDAGICHVASVPYDIQFSPEHRCNLRCVMCWSTVARNNGITPLMDQKLPENTLLRFKKLEPYIPYFQSLALNGSGEPLLSPALPGILEILAGKKAPPITFTSHLQLLNRKRAEMIVKSGVTNVTVSVDAACKETFERIRTPSKWEKLLRALDLLNTVKRELGSESPQICFAMNCMRQNIEELPGLVDFAHQHGGAWVLATNTIIYDEGMRDQALVDYPELTRAMVLEAKRRAAQYGIRFINGVLDLPEEPPALAPEASVTDGETAAVDDAPAPAPQAVPVVAPRSGRSDILKACQMPWTGLMVESDGNAKVCCYTSPYVGNLNEQTLEEIWNGEPIKALRKSFIDGCPPEGCVNCFIFTKSQQREEVFFQPVTPANGGTEDKRELAAAQN